MEKWKGIHILPSKFSLWSFYLPLLEYLPLQIYLIRYIHQINYALSNLATGHKYIQLKIRALAKILSTSQEVLKQN
jgi:hypothetical protein